MSTEAIEHAELGDDHQQAFSWCRLHGKSVETYVPCERNVLEVQEGKEDGDSFPEAYASHAQGMQKASDGKGHLNRWWVMLLW